MSEDNPKQVAREAQQSVFRVIDYAETEIGLDPIGSSDMLKDLSTFAWLRCLGWGPAEPEVLWQEFKESETWKVYYPDE